jgi:WD40 repeat protein
VRLWNLEEGQMVRVLYSHVDWVRVTACTINHAASSSEDGTIIVWDLNLDTQVLVCDGGGSG